jgi:putative photosynthetic complex assembly protein
MTTLFAEKPFPRSLLIAGGTLLLASLGLAAAARYGDIGRTEITLNAPIEQRLFIATDRPEGGIQLTDQKSGAVIALIEPGDGGFIRGVLRGFARDRRMAQLGTTDAFLLTRRADNRLTIEDTSTGRVIELEGFGATNREAFLKLLPSQGGRS